MNKEEQSRLTANVHWFNQFFAQTRQLYKSIVEGLPNEFFPDGFSLSARNNFFFPKQNQIPSIPPYYVLGVEGNQFALQVMTVLEPTLFDRSGHFAVEPSIVVVLHSQAGRYLWIDDHVLRVIRNEGIRITHQADGKLWGKMNSNPPADFFSFQVSFDKFSADKDSRDAVREHIVGPITEYLESRKTSEPPPQI